jgi:NADH-quinone oxidoreductase subunit D
LGEGAIDKTRELKYEYSRLILPIGPVHPALKEPVHFKVTVKGEEIQDVALSLSHAHRGIEALAETRNIVQNMYLVERICGICSHTHTTCFVQAVEEIKGLQPPERALYLRTLIFELERIHSHLLWAGVMAYEMGFDTLFMYTWTAREKVLDLFEETTGNRVHHSMNIIGGVRWDLTPEMIQRTSRVVEDIEKACAFIWKSFQSRTADKRLTGVGLLSTDDARSLCVVGPTARASGLTLDIRRDDPYAAYRDLKDSFSVALDNGADCRARLEVRMNELQESVNLVRTILDQLPGGDIKPADSQVRLMRVPVGEAFSRVEAPRGELTYYVLTDGKEGLQRLKVRTPSLANFAGLKNMLVGGEIADIPVVLASIDPCMSCTNRVAAVDAETGKERLIDFNDIRRRPA